MDEKYTSKGLRNSPRHPERREGSPAGGKNLEHASVQHSGKVGRSFTAFRMTWGRFRTTWGRFRMTWGVMGLRKALIILCSSLFLLSEAAQANEFVFSPRTLQWKAINSNGKVVRTGHGSGGRSYCPDTHRSCRTPTGTFHVIGKGGAGCRSSIYPVGKGGAPMPWCMYFSKKYAVHGSYEVPNRNASHGCVRLIPSDAHWLYDHFMSVGTTVVVKPY